MTRLLLVSDSHGKIDDLRRICMLYPEADRIIFLGDGAAEFEKLKGENPAWPLIGVKGNCDIGSNLPLQNELVIAGHRILIAHGHYFGVKGGTGELVDEARARGCTAAFYGHTHMQRWDRVMGVYTVNPGAVRAWPRPQYAIVDIADNGTMVISLRELRT